ncbi:hypothetical protein Hanom_Chr05g00435731 [Helianthus anomalus]
MRYADVVPLLALKVRTLCTEANPGRRFLCCISTNGCGMLRWIDSPISCPRCERLLTSQLSTNRENAELKLLKAKEVAEKELPLRLF